MKPYKKRPVAVFKISKLRRYGDFKDKVTGIKDKIAGNTTLFATPAPTVLVVTGHITAMDAAQADVQLRLPGSVATRDAAVQVVVEDVGRKWLGYVQGLADAVDYEQALIIITTAGYDVKVNNKYMKPNLRVKLTDNYSVIKLIAIAAAPKAAYEWQQSTNNGVTWTSLPSTTKASTEVSGLVAKTTYHFRFRSIVKSVTGNWSLPVSIVVQIV